MTRPDLYNDRGERARRAATVEAWRTTHGDWCPGYLTDAHAAQDLTADHVVPVAAGGDAEGELTVLCRGCNSRKGAGRRRARTSLVPEVRSREWLPGAA